MKYRVTQLTPTESGTYNEGGNILPDLLSGEPCPETMPEMLEWLSQFGYQPIEGFAGWGQVVKHTEAGVILSITENEPEDYAYTHLGFAEYHGEENLYDGNYETKFQGTPHEVIQYLTGLHAQVRGDSLTWQGSNGTWYSGDAAHEAIDKEIREIEDGTHISIAGPDEV